MVGVSTGTARGQAPDPAEIEATRTSLRALSEAITAGEVDAGPQERAYIAGALDTLDRLTNATSRVSGDVDKQSVERLMGSDR
ncbi:hypothetical protein [Pseudonocardia sp. NPDC049635]|uniref:hypothetical protein n=1 Tax=Pseudonocardia sp. NPDC049635 TaxID=3155506 RepID=UPI0033FB60DD